MQIIVTIPDKLIENLTERQNLPRRMLEAFAIEGYRSERLSLGQVAELLDFSIDEANEFLKKNRVPLNYDLEDMKQDEKAIEMFLQK
jgi:predicted HTH domain antitoxin